MSNGNWRPDFTKDDPWAGMPADYAGLATFVSTDVSPLPPWEEDAPEYIPAYGSPEYIQIAEEIVRESYQTVMNSRDKQELDRAKLIINTSQQALTAFDEFNVKSPVATSASEIVGVGEQVFSAGTIPMFPRNVLIGIAVAIGLVLLFLIIRR